jgi:prepilin-type N-terminal cleavage/methylation domain-containing protein
MAGRRSGGRRLGQEGGFTLLEVLVTIMVISIGLLAVLDSTINSAALTHGSQRTEQAVVYAQDQVEQLQSIPFAQLGLTSFPANSGTGNPPGDPYPNIPSNPNYYVGTCSSGNPGLNVQTSYFQPSQGTLRCEDFVGGGTVSPGPTTITIGNTTGQMYRYVTALPEGCVVGLTGICLGNEKRVTVAIVLNVAANGALPYKPIWTTSVVGNTQVAPLNLP